MEGLKIEALNDELQAGKCKPPNENENNDAGVGDQIAPVGGKLDAGANEPTSTALTAENDDLFEYTDSEWDVIIELKGLYLNTLENDIVLQDAAHELEKSMEPQFNAVYEERAKLLIDIRQEHSSSVLAKFWLVVLKTAFPELITLEDAPILSHLIDLRSTIYLEPDNKFTIDFVFEPNEYFSNEVLTKTYYLETMPNCDDPFTYNGAQVIGCDGCVIDWKANYAQVINEWYSFSFFDFFEPPTVPSDPDDLNFEHILRVLEKDYECGYYLKSCVIPKAVLFFTGEIGNASNSSCGSDSNETLCDLDDQDDEVAKDSAAHRELDAAQLDVEDQSDRGDFADYSDDDGEDDIDGIVEHEKTLTPDGNELDLINLTLNHKQ